jgi:hypothetical protein
MPLPRAQRALANEPGCHRRTGPPSVQVVTIAEPPEPASSSPAVPPACPTHRFRAVIRGQPRSMPTPAELKDQPVRSGPRVLPKLAVSWWPESALGPYRIGQTRIPAGTTGHGGYAVSHTAQAFTRGPRAAERADASSN